MGGLFRPESSAEDTQLENGATDAGDEHWSKVVVIEEASVTSNIREQWNDETGGTTHKEKVTVYLVSSRTIHM